MPALSSSNEAAKARARPGLKLLTPYELNKAAQGREADRARWQFLFSLNKYQPPKPEPKCRTNRRSAARAK
jgi:hypothetical protein